MTLKEGLKYYLGTGLKVNVDGHTNDLHYIDGGLAGTGLQRFPFTQKILIAEIKPLLRPLSQLTEEIEHNGERFVPLDRYDETFGSNDDYLWELVHSDSKPEDYLNAPFYVVKWLIELNMDVFDWLSQGLAEELK